jgi:hypothetical protein
VLGVSAATIDRLLVETKIAAAGGKRQRVGFYSAVRREVPIRTFNDWHDPPPGFCEVDMVALHRRLARPRNDSSPVAMSLASGRMAP